MFKDNPVGVLLLVASGIVALVIFWQIVSGERLTYTGPQWLIWILAGVMLVGTLYGLFFSKIRGEDQQWPNPGAGQRSLWDRIRGKSGSNNNSSDK